MTTAVEAPSSGGSWAPFLVIAAILTFRWISTGETGTPLRIRRWYNTKRVQIKKNLGLRDNSKYENFVAGDGANKKYKRQG
ncbi:unnamed protein product [Cylindrotheca closterium]|uniref:Uncharacterized protein n=1 Tax=Cylindrotheca closterium TaxID=2856 RepID=A0AAD2FLU6_9STRA|nr:unnamed protein product [Cylindrotheca closterium]